MGITAEYWGQVTGGVGSLGSKGPVIYYGEWGGGEAVLPLQKKEEGGGGYAIAKIIMAPRPE